MEHQKKEIVICAIYCDGIIFNIPVTMDVKESTRAEIVNK